MRRYRGYKTYEGSTVGGAITARTVSVMVEDHGYIFELPPRHDLRNHSPDGFNWGYAGSGPAQLALALVVDACGDEYGIPAVYQRYKQRIVANLPGDGWTLTVEQVRDVVSEITSKLDPDRLPHVFPPDESTGD